MKLICQSCGATASAELWRSNAAAREALLLALRLPKAVQDTLLEYLSLFRPAKSALSWSTACTLIDSLDKLVSEGRVCHDKNVPRPCAAGTWAEAMTLMIERFNGQRPKLKNHNYLRAVAYPLANAADAQNERNLEDKRRARRPDHVEEEETWEGQMPAGIKTELKGFGIGRE